MPGSSNVYEVQKFRFANHLGSDLELWLEPIGDCVMIPAHATFEIHLEHHSPAQVSDCLEIAIAAKKATIFGWLQSIFLVTEDEKQTRIWPSS